MHKVLFKLNVFEYLSWYFRIYREYYENLYKDSWIWSENKIIDWYIQESIQRKKEIIKITSKNCYNLRSTFRNVRIYDSFSMKNHIWGGIRPLRRSSNKCCY